MNFFIFVICGVCAGISVLLSYAYGAHDNRAFRVQLFQSFLFGAGAAAALSLLGIILLRPLTALIQTPDEMAGYVITYLTIIFAGLIASFLYNFCSAVLRSIGNTFMALCFLMVSVIPNIVLDLLFAAVFRCGISGAAYATCHGCLPRYRDWPIFTGVTRSSYSPPAK